MTAKLLVVQGRPSGKSLRFPSGVYYFGRGPECHVRPESEWVSRQHCLLTVTDDAVFVRDLGSRNGTLVNGSLVESERQLVHGDQVQIGPLVFEVQLDRDALKSQPGPSNNDAVSLGTDSTAEVEIAQQTTSRMSTGEAGVDESSQQHPTLPGKATLLGATRPAPSEPLK